MKLADETVIAAKLRIEEAAACIGDDDGGGTIRRSRNSPVTVSGLDGRAVKNEKDQQQPEPPLECGATVLE
jgi:hypothetical protein